MSESFEINETPGFITGKGVGFHFLPDESKEAREWRKRKDKFAMGHAYPVGIPSSNRPVDRSSESSQVYEAVELLKKIIEKSAAASKDEIIEEYLKGTSAKASVILEDNSLED